MNVSSQTGMPAEEAIRLRRSVRTYADRPLAETEVDELLKLALSAPSGSLADAWSLIVVRDPGQRAALADIVIRGARIYFESVIDPAPGTSREQHAQWVVGFADDMIGLRTYPQVPVWVVGLVVPRSGIRPPEHQERDRIDNLLSLGFAMENLFVAARSRGLGTVPTSFHRYLEEEFRQLLEIPSEIEAPVLTPLGYPVGEIPAELPPPLQQMRRPWRSLVHDDRWGNPRELEPATLTLRQLLTSAG